jgi:hypothetical protein
MKTYTNNIEINGQVFTHTVEATDYSEALRINRKRKEDAAMRGRRIFGRLVRND